MYEERDFEQRQKFQEELSKIPKEKIIWMDEAGIEEILEREYGKAPKGERVIGEITGKRVPRRTIMAGYRNKKMIAPLYFKGTTVKEVVDYWCEKILKEEINEGDVVVMDNATFHKYSKAESIIESLGGRVIWQPKYSPDLNKIEPQWANLKNGIRSNQDEEKSFYEKLDLQIIKMCT
jgi:transposase